MKALKLIPIGGCGEIGLNMTMLQAGNQWFFIDCGVLFPDAGAHGIDLVIPDFDMIEAAGIRPVAWIVTHGHEDHIGALPYALQKFPAPIFGSELSMALVREKLSEHGVAADIRPWKRDETIDFGEMVLQPIAMGHSIPDAMALVFETEEGTLLHTGDFRISARSPALLDRLRQAKPVRFMMADSTNALTPGWEMDEEDLVESFVDIMEETQGAVVVVTFASSIWRYGTVLQAARKAGRKVLFLGKTMQRNLELGQKFNMLPSVVDLVLDESELDEQPRGSVCIVCAGSQGEMFSGAQRLASGLGKTFRLSFQDQVVFSSKIIPGNEKNVARLVNEFARIDVPVITASHRRVHVSGHGFREEICEMIRAIEPEFFIPIHGEIRHLKAHRDLAVECGVAPEKCLVIEDGDVVSLTKHAIEKSGRMELARCFVSQRKVLNAEQFRERMQMARQGLVHVVFPVGPDLRELTGSVLVYARGTPFSTQGIDLDFKALFTAVVDRFDERLSEVVLDSLVEELRVVIRRQLERVCGYRTLVVADCVVNAQNTHTGLE